MKKPDKDNILMIVGALYLMLCPLLGAKFMIWFTPFLFIVSLLWYSYTPKSKQD